MLWEKFEEYIIKHNIEVSKNMKVTQVKESGEHYIVSYEDAEGKSQSIETKNIFFSNPLLEFIDIFEGNTPEEVIKSAQSLEYRNHISVHVTIDKKLFDVEVEMPHEDIQKLVKEYKKLKKYQKSSMCEIEKLSGKKTKVDKLVDKYNS